VVNIAELKAELERVTYQAKQMWDDAAAKWKSLEAEFDGIRDQIKAIEDHEKAQAEKEAQKQAQSSAPPPAPATPPPVPSPTPNTATQSSTSTPPKK